MTQGFHHRLLNGYFEDPCVYVRVPWESRAIQFDIGDISELGRSEAQKITDVFVTHTHIDHFIGFDMLLRTLLRREIPLNVYGPRSITACVEGKLRGYSWNLIRDYPTVVNVFAYGGRTVTHSVFRAAAKFRKETVGITPSDGLLLKDPLFRVRAVKLDHDIPCLAFALEEELHINIDKDLLIRRGLSVGPWLTSFKKLLRENREDRGKLFVDGNAYTVAELSDIARITKGQKISYATDFALTGRNIAKITRFVEGSDVFYCEAFFLEEDRSRALERFHITARTCGEIAGKAGVKRLLPMHFSPRYSENPEKILTEAMEAFGAASKN